MSNYLDSAVRKLNVIGIMLPKPESNPILPLLEQVSYYDNSKVMEIASSMQMSSAFNEVVRTNIEGMQISTRYADITSSFNSVVTDLQSMNDWMADGKLDFSEKVKLKWMHATRGSVPDRFNTIRKNYLSVAASANDQIQREGTVLEAYKDFRLALKNAEVIANEVLQQNATPALQAKRAALEAASKAVEAYTGEDSAERARLEMARDEAMLAMQKEDKSFQFVKNLADDLKTSYNTTELIYARIQQTYSVKEALYRRAIEFFTTNESVFTGLSAAFTQSAGLAEATNAVEAMKDGMSKGLEALATTAGKTMENGLRAAYGETLRVSSVKMLADAVVEWQRSSMTMIEDLRKQSSESAKEIETATEDSKRRFVQLVTKGV